MFGVDRALPVEAVRAVQRGADVRQAVLVNNALVKKTLMQVGQGSPYCVSGCFSHFCAPLAMDFEEHKRHEAWGGGVNKNRKK